ncbi:hypothetical protein SDC9_169006 [bioreactor metagenome]|uniref:Uncharacterized protein n=1 Tax=bioreactor metagenome TaxID=1076179 RepID=A0A645G671_9ZZZZ
MHRLCHRRSTGGLHRHAFSVRCVGQGCLRHVVHQRADVRHADFAHRADRAVPVHASRLQVARAPAELSSAASGAAGHADRQRGRRRAGGRAGLAGLQRARAYLVRPALHVVFHGTAVSGGGPNHLLHRRAGPGHLHTRASDGCGVAAPGHHAAITGAAGRGQLSGGAQ